MLATLKILLVPSLVLGLTAFGMVATVLTQRDPSPAARMTFAAATISGFVPYDGKPLLY